MNQRTTIHQVNLQPAIGGGEIYTRFFTRALAEAGAAVRLFVRRGNAFWNDLAAPHIEVIAVDDPEDIVPQLPARGALILTQSPLPDVFLDLAAREHLLTGFAHMPMLGRNADEFHRYREVYTVSQYCIDLLKKAGISHTYPAPLYGTWQLERPQAGQIVARSPYTWDARKFRDRLLGALEPLAEPFRAREVFARRPGLTLGIVSLLSPIKQFPLLFGKIAPLLARHSDINLEIFGNGGYAQVRDIRSALDPLGKRARFWGFQIAVQAIYPQLDYLMTGLAEKEALGLNAIEAQACGTPVLAPRGAPFTETILDGETGYLYRDPREDGGADFAALMGRLPSGEARPDPRRAKEHLAQFTYEAMVMRARRLLGHLATRIAEWRDE